MARQEFLQLNAVGESGQRVVARQKLNARLRLHSLSNIRHRATKAGATPLVPDGFRHQMANAAFALRAHKLAAQRRGGAAIFLTHQPGHQRVAGVRQQTIDMLARPVGNLVACQAMEAGREIDQPSVLIGFPDPV